MARDTVCVVYAAVQTWTLGELRAVHEHERQPVAHITTWGLSSARVSNAETPGLMCARIMENNENIAEVPGNQFSFSFFFILMKRTDAMKPVPTSTTVVR